MTNTSWTLAQPVEQGYYWAIEQGEDHPIVVEVMYDLPRELCVWNPVEETRVALSAFRCWAGPISPPYGPPDLNAECYADPVLVERYIDSHGEPR